MSEKIARRGFLTGLSIGVAGIFSRPFVSAANHIRHSFQSRDRMKIILSVKPMGFQWETLDPFLFCVHHEDFFPSGNENMGPTQAALKGRSLGDDFIIKDGFRMYHGKTVPGFPGHPHRGFETITVVRKGMVDHADSMGAAGRYGNGDVQWMTAGKGVQHSEMFPLLSQEKDNPLELFQIWLNLPKRNKMTAPHFKMLWSEDIPHYSHKDSKGKATKVEVIAGKLGDKIAPAPPPGSWAADAANCVAIWNIKMDAGAEWLLPKAQAGINRTIYFYQGNTLNVAGEEVSTYKLVQLAPDAEVLLKCGDKPASILLLQGKPINEPVIQYGPFVMNTKEEINQAFEDYHRTKFGGWPWSRYDQVHPREKGRFAKHADGRIEQKS